MNIIVQTFNGFTGSLLPDQFSQYKGTYATS